MDAKTSTILLSANLICSGSLLMLVAQRIGGEANGVRQWAHGLLLYGASFAVGLLGGLGTESMLAVVGNVGTLAALLLLLRGLEAFVGIPHAGYPIFGAVAAYAVVQVVTAMGGGVVPRVIEHNLVIGVASLWLVGVALRARRSLPPDCPMRTPVLAIAVISAVVSLMSVTRAVSIGLQGMAVAYRGWLANIFFAVGSTVAMAVALILLWLVFLRLNEQLARLATRDALTDVLNRNGLEQALQRHFAPRSPAPLTLLAVDIDHFKAINDLRGHAVGDEVLRKVAQTLRGQLRGDDFVARVGGEEFVVGCAVADGGQAVELGERLRREVARQALAQAGGEPVRCTVSIGVSAPFQRQADYERALHVADRALYAAKAAGRDRVVFESGVPALSPC